MNQYKSIGIVAIYFGKLPDYINLWVRSCMENPSVDFLLFTDQNIIGKTQEEHEKILKEAPNIKIINMQFKELKVLFENKLNMKISLETPFKICDFRPAFGILLDDYLKKYDFWGHCDLDQIFGDIRSFISEEILDKYKRILYLGHLSIYKNTPEINTAYKLPGSLYNYKKVFSTKENYAFDEITGSKMIFENNNILIYDNKIFADISCKYERMHLYGDERNKMHQVFYWENGKLFRAYIEEENVKVDEFIYIHFQKKHPINKVENPFEVKSFYILDNQFKEKEPGIPSLDEVKEFSHFKSYKEDKNQARRYMFKKLKQFACVSIKQKKIWMKQKISLRM